jgi:hypothetical protein
VQELVIKSNDINEVKRRIGFEFYYPTVPHFNQLTYFNTLEFNASTLIGVYDDSMTESEQDAFIISLRQAYSQLTLEDREQVVFTWVNYKELSDYD